MKIRIALSLVVFVLSTSFASCNTIDTKTIIVVVSCSEIQNNKQITSDLVANIGDIIMIELCSYLTMYRQPTDYRWQYVNQGWSSGPIVREKSYELVVPKSEGANTGAIDVGFEGASEKQKWTFEVIGKGNNVIRMKYVINQLGVEEIHRSYSMNVTVK